METKLYLVTFFLLFGSQYHLINSESVETTPIISRPKNELATRFRRKRSNSCDNSWRKWARTDCGWWGVNQEQCEAMKCCFDSSESNVPNCYIGNSGIRTLEGTCDFSKPKDRGDCGWSGVTKSQCESRNCCYDSRVSGANNCFHSNQQAITLVTTSSSGLQKADIEKLISLENKVITSMNVMKQRILKAHRDYSIAKTVGSSVSSAGTVATIAGLVLAPFTAGWSLGLTVGGLTSTVLGAGTTLTTGIISTVKTKEWADELIDSFGELEEELREIGEKIVTHPDWQEYVKQAGKGALYVAFKGPAALHLGRMVKYLAITAPQYGLHKWPAYYFAVTRLPGQFLLKTNTLLTRNLARMGIHTVKMGVTGLQLLSVGLGVVGIGFDVYTIVDTWTSDPELVTQIDQLIRELESSRDKLVDFKNEF